MSLCVTCLLPLCVCLFFHALALLVRLSSSAEEWFNQCECASVPACLVCFVAGAGKKTLITPPPSLIPPWHPPQSTVVSHTLDFFSTPTPTPTDPPTHTARALDVVNAQFFCTSPFMHLIMKLLTFRPETRSEWQIVQHFGHAQASTADKRCSLTLFLIVNVVNVYL